MNKLTHSGPEQPHQPKPLVALLDGRDCSLEMPLLKDIATVAFCDAQLTTEIHEKVLNEAVAALLYSIRLSRDDLLKFRSLKVIVKIGNPDVHNVDLVAATELGIAVCNTPAEAVEEAADHTISLILNMFRRTFWVARTVQMGKKLQNMDQLRELMAGSKRVRGSTLGIVGFGRIGSAVALRAKALGFRVCFFDPHISNGMERAFGVERSEKLAELLAQSDCITLHCPIGHESRHLMNNDSLKRLKSGAFFVNIGQADLIDMKALIVALKSGQIKAAAFDINQRAMPNEQFADFESLINMPNVIWTPNCAWFSDEALKEMRISAAKEVRRALTAGSMPENLQNCINKSDLLALRLAKIQQQQQRGLGIGHQNGFAGELGMPHNQQTAAPGIGVILSKSNNAIIGGPMVNQYHGNDISTNFATITAGNTSAEYSIQPPPISIDGITSADSLQNATTLLAYQNLMMRNPQLLVAAGLGTLPSAPTILPTSMSAQNIPATTAHQLNNDFGPTTTTLNAHLNLQFPANASPLTGTNLHLSSKSPSGSRPSSKTPNMTNVPTTTTKLQKPEPKHQEKAGMPIEYGQERREVNENERKFENYPSQQSATPTTMATAEDSPVTSPHGRLLIADEREDEDGDLGGDDGNEDDV